MAPVSPYKKLRDNQATKAMKRDLTSLVRGRLYIIYDFDMVESQFSKNGRKPMCLRAYYTDGTMRFFSYMTSDYQDIAKDDFLKMKQDINDKKPASICFYGVMANKYMVQLHEFGEVDKELLETCSTIEEAMANKPKLAATMKREHEEDDCGPSTKEQKH